MKSSLYFRSPMNIDIFDMASIVGSIAIFLKSSKSVAGSEISKSFYSEDSLQSKDARTYQRSRFCRLKIEWLVYFWQLLSSSSTQILQDTKIGIRLLQVRFLLNTSPYIHAPVQFRGRESAIDSGIGCTARTMSVPHFRCNAVKWCQHICRVHVDSLSR